MISKILTNVPRLRGKQSPKICHLFSPPDWPTQSPLLGWYITHPSPNGPPKSPKATKNTTEIARSHLAAIFINKVKSPKIFS